MPSKKTSNKLQKVLNSSVEWWSTLNFYMKLGTILIVSIIFYFLMSIGMDYVDTKKDKEYRKEREELIMQIEKLKTESEIREVEIQRLLDEREVVRGKIKELESLKPKKRDKPASFDEIDSFFKDRGF